MDVKGKKVTPIAGDLDGSGAADGADIGPFVEAVLTASVAPCIVARADFNGDGMVTTEDLPGFQAALLAA